MQGSESIHGAAPKSLASLLWDARQGVLTTSGLGPVSTGFHPLDGLLDGGLLPGEVVLVGGQPGSGKTICALQWARHIAGQRWGALFACFEHDEATLLYRLLVQEVAAAPDIDATQRLRAKSFLRDVTLGLMPFDQAAELCPEVARSFESLGTTASHLHLLRASSQITTPDELSALVADHLEVGGVLFVDYLQKVPIRSASTVDEQVYRAIESLKQLAVDRQITVVALSAASASGINVDRMRLKHLRGSDALAHECDIAIMLNQKATAVSDRHVKFDLTQLDSARKQTVFSIEKNRRGEVDVHMEFRKDFGNFRFNPRGDFMTEALEDD